MKNVRCQCGKILCQNENESLIIMCRHCKRYYEIDLKELELEKKLFVPINEKEVLIIQYKQQH